MITFKRVWAIFIKQWKDTIKNKAIFIQFVIFPIIALILTETIAKGNSEIPEPILWFYLQLCMQEWFPM